MLTTQRCIVQDIDILRLGVESSLAQEVRAKNFKNYQKQINKQTKQLILETENTQQR